MGVNRLNIVTIVVQHRYAFTHTHTPTQSQRSLTGWLDNANPFQHWTKKKNNSNKEQPMSQPLRVSQRENETLHATWRVTETKEAHSTRSSNIVCLFIIIIIVSDSTVRSILVFLLYTAVTLWIRWGSTYIHAARAINSSLQTVFSASEQQAKTQRFSKVHIFFTKRSFKWINKKTSKQLQQRING